MSFVATNGNTDTQSVGLGGHLVYRPDGWVFSWRSSFVRHENDAVVTAQAVTAQTRADRHLGERLTTFAEYGYLRDRFAGVQHRHTLGAGLSFVVERTARQSLVADAGVGYTNERRSGADVSRALVLGGGSYRLKVSESADVGDELRIDLLFDEPSNWRVANAADVTSRLTRIFSLKVSNTLRIANRPPPGFDRVDTITAVALVANF